jgi:hypothetical protein
MAYRTTISGLTPGTYGFRFKTADDTGRFGDWSPVFQYTVTGDITPPPATSKPVVESVMGGVYVKWVESAYNAPVDFNRVDVYVSTGGAYTKFGSIATIGAGITYTPATGTGPFTFKFTGVDRSGNVSAFSEASDAVSAGSLSIDTEPPAIPGGLSVTAGNDSTDPSGDSGYVDVSWTASSSTDLLGYYIRYGRSATVWDEYVFMEKGQLTKRIYGLRSGTTYYFQINATDGSNPSAYIPATPISVTVPADTSAPAAPTGLVAVAGFNNVIAYWNRNTEKDVDLGRGTYEFQISTSSTFASILQTRTITGTVATFTGLTTEQIYYVRVRAIDSSGNTGSWSTVASATPGKISGSASITNGTIVGDLVAANTIVGDKLVANTIDADRLKTNTGIVGKLYVGDEAATNKVVIDGTAAIPAFYQGTGTYNSTSTGFYLDGAGKFSLKDKLTWDTSTLIVKGSLNVTQASTFTGNVTLNSGGDILLNGGAIRATGTTGRVEIGSLGIYGYNATTGGTPQVRIDANTGQITAIGGTIGGWTLSASSLTTTNSAGNTVGLYSDGRLYMGPNFSVAANGSATFSGTVTIVGTGSNVPTTQSVNDSLATKVGSADVKNHLGGTNVTTISGGIINTGTINLNNVNVNNGTGNSTIRLSSSGLEIYNSVGTRTVYLNPSGSAEFTGSIKSGSTITGSSFTAGTINVTGETISSATGDGEGTAGDPTGVSSNAFSSTYVRNSITTVGFNAVAFTSVTTAGVVSSWYPYYDASVDLGVRNSTTYSTAPYRWRNLRLTGTAYFGGNGYSDTLSSSTPTANQIKVAINGSGTIYANLLGVDTGTAIVQSSAGYLKVSSSSRRYKENIQPITGSYLDSVRQLVPVTFTYKEEFSGRPDNPTVAGLIAEDVAEIEKLNGIVNYNTEGTPESISYDRLSIFLAISIKELSDKLDVITARLDALEG